MSLCLGGCLFCLDRWFASLIPTLPPATMPAGTSPSTQPITIPTQEHSHAFALPLPCLGEPLLPLCRGDCRRQKPSFHRCRQSRPRLCRTRGVCRVRRGRNMGFASHCP